MKELDPIEIPLEGVHIIEASAGTGKTYAISNIFLRFVLEKGLPLENILIVSFTESATNELRYRIRKRLQEALNALLTNSSEDVFLKKLLSKVKEKELSSRLLKRAIMDLDSLTISTIHGFCRKVIADNSFESGVLLDTKLVVDLEPIKQEVIYDFWRRYIYKESPLFIDYMKKSGFDIENVIFLIDLYLIRPYAKVIPDVSPEPELSKYEKEYKELIKEIFKGWSHSKDQIAEMLLNSKSLNRRVYNRKNVMKWISYLDQFLNTGGYEFAISDIIKRFSKSHLQKNTKKGCAFLDHPFFEYIEKLILLQERLEDFYKKKLVFIKRKLIEYMEKELDRKKMLKNLMGFDDLIRMVYKGILNGGLLKEALRNRFLVGMIDEFQDTDPVQYEIFKNIFSAENHALYLIGDPKQSIYSFRGADIFTYIKASKDIDSKFTLKENWRSCPKLIEGINRIFSGIKNSFFYKEILFLPAKPAKDSNVKPLCLDNVPEIPLKIWTFSKKEANVSEIKDKIATVVAEEISTLLYLGKKGRLKIGDNNVIASDIAVLVRRNAEARLIQNKLASFHIPAVIYSASNIFESWEYKEIQRILYGIYHYNNESYLKAALGTDMMGLKAEDMELLDEEQWEDYMKRFKEYHELWNRFGFITMFREFLNKEAVMPRLMRFEDGERRCTNVIHLMEVIHEAEKEYMLGMEGIIKWLANQRKAKVQHLEEYQLRLESDESAVKIITVHRSKGLEFPIVFLPFAWEGIFRRTTANAPVIFHDPEKGYIMDIGSELKEENALLEKQETLAEDIRLLYVALTRARNCCYLILSEENDPNSSAISYLFSGIKKEELVNGMKDKILIAPLPEPGYGQDYFEERKEELILRKFSANVDTSWRITSFSSLTSNRIYEEAQDLDRIQEKEEIEEELKEPYISIFSFPKGAKAGIFFHDLMQNLDFTEKDENIKELVLVKLKEHGFEDIWADTIFSMIRNVIHCPLDPEIEGLTLSHISMQDRINEMEFYFPLKKINPEMINAVLRKCGISLNGFIYKEGDLRFDPVEGFMRGFIDMIFCWKGRFFLVDWKSNLLGESLEHYSQESLKNVMQKELYMLQLLIYTVALNQYLKTNLSDYSYEKHFGKAYYLFLRGINPEAGPDYGIFRYRPEPQLIEHLCKILIP